MWNKANVFTTLIVAVAVVLVASAIAWGLTSNSNKNSDNTTKQFVACTQAGGSFVSGYGSNNVCVLKG